MAYANNICHFWDHHRARFPKKIQSTETYTNGTTLCSGFFPHNVLGDGPAFWTFFQDSRIRVKPTDGTDCDVSGSLDRDILLEIQFRQVIVFGNHRPIEMISLLDQFRLKLEGLHFHELD